MVRNTSWSGPLGPPKATFKASGRPATTGEVVGMGGLFRSTGDPNGHVIMRLLMFLFQNIDALDTAVARLPWAWPPFGPTPEVISESEHLLVDLKASPEQLAALRASLALAGDSGYICERLARLPLRELAAPVQELLDQLRVFRSASAASNESEAPQT